MSSKKKELLVLGIESSCDETAASVVQGSGRILSNIIASQVKIHSPYGGVVPELASRHHLKNCVTCVEKGLHDASVDLKDLSCIAATQGPGLVGALVVGFSFAKAIAITQGLPFVGVNHIKAHLHAITLEHKDVPYPHIGLIVSGGHTSLYLVKDPLKQELIGATRDDAAGEAFDKVAKVMGLGYPGGPIISALAERGDPTRFQFPRAHMPKTPFDFSFSGLKTAVINTVRSLKDQYGELPTADIAASFQEAVVDVLCQKAISACDEYGVKTLVMCGGVASNPRLRESMATLSEKKGIQCLIPSPILCTDNAAMVAAYGLELFGRGITTGANEDVYSRAI